MKPAALPCQSQGPELTQDPVDAATTLPAVRVLAGKSTGRSARDDWVAIGMPTHCTCTRHRLSSQRDGTGLMAASYSVMASKPGPACMPQTTLAATQTRNAVTYPEAGS